MSEPFQVSFLLDLVQITDAELTAATDDEGAPLLPLRRRSLRLALSEHGGPTPAPPGVMKGPYDWPRLAGAVETMVHRAQREMGTAGDYEVFIAGRAPLPLFVQLGYSLTKYVSTCVLNPWRGGPWKRFPLTGPVSGDFFDVVVGSDRRQISDGWVAIFVSTIGTPIPEEGIRTLWKERGWSLGGSVEIRTSVPKDVHPADMPNVAAQLNKEISVIPGSYPQAEGFCLLVAGPAQLACAVGAASSRNVFNESKPVHVANYTAPKYEIALTLPFVLPGPPLVPRDPADDLARADVLQEIVDGIDELRHTLQEHHFPEAYSAGMKRRWLRYLKDLRIARDPEGDAFELRIVHRELRLGRALLQALRARDASMQRRFGQLLLLHELFHDGQELRSSNYYEVGRAGVVLEEVDFYADTFALRALVAWDLEQGGPRAAGRAARVTEEWVDTVIAGIETFDRFEQGKEIKSLYERRLRRYLVWHLQRARAAAIREPAHAQQLFRDRLIVELAPLSGKLDDRGDKLVTSAVPERTELFVALEGSLIRQPPRPGFDPAKLVEAVRRFDRATLAEQMHFMVEEHRRALLPWLVDDTG